ncbi:MAG: SDR family NAD(P)-dependent oxidoreductase [Gammaproteobacteria bacterium]|nr:SDR family NAD(P)-dependent oxidoreductase [Gammaproteobacteria bacterium]
MKTIPETFRATEDMLKDKVILVTGATGGFGKTVSLSLASHGATVILVARNLRLVESLYDEIEQAGCPTPAIYPINLEGATEHDYLELANNIESQLGRLDGMIHCAAILGAPTVFAQSDATTWYQVHQVNLHAPYLLTRACLSLLSRSENSSILFMMDDKPGAYWDAYQVSKQGLAAMAGLLAREYEGSNLRINCFNPGKTRTALHLRAYPAADVNDQLPTPEHHIDTFLYLMSDEVHENGELFGKRGQA